MKKSYKWWYFTKHLKIMCSTGPLMIDRIYKKNMDKSQLLEIIVPCSVCNIDECAYNKKYFLRGIRGDSWHSWDSYMINIIHCNKISIFYIILIIILIIIIIYQIMR
jgi:hypothetical protein